MALKKTLLFIFIQILLAGCCDENKITMQYHFFTKTELANLYINQDSVMNFQEEVSKEVTFEQFNKEQRIYIEVDTVLFQSEKGDTIAYRYDNLIQINDNSDELAISPETTTSATINLRSIDSSFMPMAFYSMQKSSKLERDSLAHNIGFTHLDSMNNELIANLYKSGSIAQDGTYYIISKEDVVLKGVSIDNCLIVRFYDKTLSEQASIVYSNKYGFLKIKNTQHEIIRIL